MFGVVEVLVRPCLAAVLDGRIFFGEFGAILMGAVVNVTRRSVALGRVGCFVGTSNTSG